MNVNEMLNSGTVDLATLENLVKMMKSQQLAEVKTDELPDLLAKSATISGGSLAKDQRPENSSVVGETPFSSSSSSSTVPPVPPSFATTDAPLFSDVSNIKFTVGKGSSPSKKKPTSKAASPAVKNLSSSMGKMDLGEGETSATRMMPPAPPVFNFSIDGAPASSVPLTSADSDIMSRSPPKAAPKFAGMPQTSSSENTNYFTFNGKENFKFSPGTQVVSPSSSSRATSHPIAMPTREPSLVPPGSIPTPAAAPAFANFVFDDHIANSSPADATGQPNTTSAAEDDDEHEAEWGAGGSDSDSISDPSEEDLSEEEEEGLVINKANKARWAREYAADQAAKLDAYQKYVDQEDDDDESMVDPSGNENSDSDSGSEYNPQEDGDDSVSVDSDRYRKEEVDGPEDSRYFQQQNSKTQPPAASPAVKPSSAAGMVDLRPDKPIDLSREHDQEPGSPMDCSSPVQAPTSAENVWKEPSYLNTSSGASPTSAAPAGVMPPPPPFVFSHGSKTSSKVPSATASAGPIGMSNYFGETKSASPAKVSSAPFGTGTGSSSDASMSIDLNVGTTPSFSMGTSDGAGSKKKPNKPAVATKVASPGVKKGSPIQTKIYNARTGQYYEISSDSDSEDIESEVKTRTNVESLKKSTGGGSVDDLGNQMGEMWGQMPAPKPPSPTRAAPAAVPPPPPANPRTSTTNKPQFGASLSARMAAGNTTTKPKPTSASAMPEAPSTTPSAYPPAPPVPPTAASASAAGNKMGSSMAIMADGHRKEGKQFYEKELYEKAYSSFTKALEIAPSDWFYKATVLGNRAASLMMLDRFVEAADDCKNAMAIDPTLVRLHSRRARALCKLGELTEATTAYTKVLEHVSASTMASVKAHATGATTLSQAAGSAAAASAEDTNNKRDAQDGLKQLATARDLLLFITREDGKDNAWTSKGSSATSTASLSARELMSKVDDLLAICPQMRRAHAFKAKGLVKQGLYKDAKDYVEGVIRGTPSSVLALHSHPAATFPVPTRNELTWTANGKIAGQKVVVKTTSLTNFFLVIGSGDGSSSLAEWYINALKNQDICRLHSTEVINFLSTVLDSLASTCTSSSTGGMRYSRTSSIEWISTENEKSTTWISLKKQADSLFRSGNYAEAIRVYTDLLKVDPEATKFNCVIYSNRAAGYMSLCCYSEAIGDCNKAISLDEEFSRAYLRRARAHRAQKHWAASIRDFRRYLSSDPTPLDGVAVQKEMEETGIERDKQTQRQQTGSSSAGTGSSGSGSAKSRPSYWDYYSKAGANAEESEDSDKNQQSKGKSPPSKGKSGDKYNCYYNPASGKYESRPGGGGGMKGEQESSSSESESEDEYDGYSTKPTSQTSYDYEAYRSQFYSNVNKKKANAPPPAPNSSNAGANKYNSTKPAPGPSTQQRAGAGGVAYNPATNSYYYTNEPPKPSKPTPKPTPKPTSSYNSNPYAKSNQKSSYSTYSDDDDYGWNSHSKPASGGTSNHSNPYANYYSSKTAGSGSSNYQRTSSSGGGGSNSYRSNSSSNNKPATKAKADDHYTTLGVHPTRSTEADIKKAYRKLAMKYHPDKNKDESAVGMFQNISNAYSVLSDSTARRKYDLSKPY